MSAILDAALVYARQGLPVFPCNFYNAPPYSKRPLTEHGFNDATIDEPQIYAWWGRRFPHAMIGVPTGPRSGRWVLDLDVDLAKGIDGEQALARLEGVHGELPETLVCQT